MPPSLVAVASVCPASVVVVVSTLLDGVSATVGELPSRLLSVEVLTSSVVVVVVRVVAAGASLVGVVVAGASVVGAVAAVVSGGLVLVVASDGWVALVEGDTDRVVIETVADRSSQLLDARGIAVIPVGSKEGLRIPFHLLTNLGITCFVVADGDALGADRRHPQNPEKAKNARASHKKSTAQLVGWLPSHSSVSLGATPYSFGDPTTVTDRWAILHDDLETELEQWPGFAHFLPPGMNTRSKNSAVYRYALQQADISQIPTSLRSLVIAIANCTTQS